jgi:hypothetical protein
MWFELLTFKRIWFLDRCWAKMDLEGFLSQIKFVPTKSEMSMGKRYLCDGLFKNNMIIIVKKKTRSLIKLLHLFKWLSLLIHFINRSNEPLGLIHYNICDLKFMQTTSGKRYFITFINDYTRYWYVYLKKKHRWGLKIVQTFQNKAEN